MALTNKELDAINGDGSADLLAAHRAEQERIADLAHTEKAGILGSFTAEKAGVVGTRDAQVATQEARTTAQQAVVGGELAADTITAGESAFLPGTTTPLGEAGVTVNPDATARPAEVTVNPPKPPTAQ